MINLLIPYVNAFIQLTTVVGSSYELLQYIMLQGWHLLHFFEIYFTIKMFCWLWHYEQDRTRTNERIRRQNSSMSGIKAMHLNGNFCMHSWNDSCSTFHLISLYRQIVSNSAENLKPNTMYNEVYTWSPLLPHKVNPILPKTHTFLTIKGNVIFFEFSCNFFLNEILWYVTYNT